jgi:hypothetical protein
MPPTNAQQSNLILEAHEDRIQNLENQIPEVLAGQATTNMQLVSMDKKLDSIDSSVKKVSTDLDIRLTVLEKDKANWVAAKNVIRKIATPFVLILTALLGKFGDQVWEWLTR